MVIWWWSFSGGHSVMVIQWRSFSDLVIQWWSFSDLVIHWWSFIDGPSVMVLQWWSFSDLVIQWWSFTDGQGQTGRLIHWQTDRHTDRQTDRSQNSLFFTPERGKSITLYASLTDRNSALLPFRPSSFVSFNLISLTSLVKLSCLCQTVFWSN